MFIMQIIIFYKLILFHISNQCAKLKYGNGNTAMRIRMLMAEKDDFLNLGCLIRIIELAPPSRTS